MSQRGPEPSPGPGETEPTTRLDRAIAANLDNSIECWQLKFMQLDHFVIHADPDPQLTVRIGTDCKRAGLEFDPTGDRNFDAFSAHCLYVGLEYLEIIQLIRPAESGWIPQWLERYQRGVRGIYCIFLASQDLAGLAEKLRAQGFDAKAERSSFVDVNGTEYPFPWRHLYMPPIPGTDVELSFIQYDSPRLALREIFEPNSDKNGFTGIQSAELSLPMSNEAKTFLKKIFPQTENTNSGLRILLENSELCFKPDRVVSLHLTTRGTDHRFSPNSIQIANVKLETKIT